MYQNLLEISHRINLVYFQSNACIVWRRFANLFETSQSLFWASFGLGATKIEPFTVELHIIQLTITKL